MAKFTDLTGRMGPLQWFLAVTAAVTDCASLGDHTFSNGTARVVLATDMPQGANFTSSDGFSTSTNHNLPAFCRAALRSQTSPETAATAEGDASWMLHHPERTIGWAHHALRLSVVAAYYRHDDSLSHASTAPGAPPPASPPPAAANPASPRS